jgi:hypothetical protein
MMHVIWVPRALENWALKDLPGWDLPNLTDVEWIFKRIGAGVGAHSHLAFLARSRLPRLRRVRLVLKELAEGHVDELARFFARHPHCYRFEAIFSAPKVVLPLFPHIAACELFIRGVPSVTGAICNADATRQPRASAHFPALKSIKFATRTRDVNRHPISPQLLVLHRVSECFLRSECNVHEKGNGLYITRQLLTVAMSDHTTKMAKCSYDIRRHSSGSSQPHRA